MTTPTLLFWVSLATLLAPGVQAQAVKLTASDASAQAFFGFSVALSGNTLVVGAPNDAAERGAAYVYARDPAAGWMQQAKLTAGEAEAGDAFGFSVAVDGRFAVVGAPGDDDGGNDAGAAYVFFNDPLTGWTRQAKLTADDAALGDAFGHAVALSGLYALAGAPGDDDGAFDTGAAYVFAFDPLSGWRRQDKLRALSADDGDAFGSAVALLDETALVGAPLADEARGTDAGLAFVFVRAGDAWPLRATLTAGDAAPAHRFGAAVALGTDPVRDRERALVGSPNVNLGPSEAGAAYLFTNFDTLWTQTARLTADVRISGDHVGHATALRGNAALVGTPDADEAGPDAGAAYFFTFDRILGWTQQATLTDAAPGTGFGHAVALDDVFLFVAAPADDEAAHDAGAVYVYDRTALDTAAERPPDPPALRLTAPYPNPFRRATTIPFEVPPEAVSRPVRLAVYDLLGREVAVLVNAPLPAGRHEATWTAEGLPSGVYVYRLQMGGQIRAGRMVLMR